MKLSTALEKVMALAKVIREYWETELPKRHPNYPLVYPGEQPVPPPPEEKKLGKLLAGFPEEIIYQLGLLMDMGRGHRDIHDLAKSYRRLKENYGSATELASLLAAKEILADYLEEGLAELKKQNMDLDRLSLKPAKARK
jgi:hypothetical protein